MLVRVFCSDQDKITDSLQQMKGLNIQNIRSLIQLGEEIDCKTSVVLMSYHSTNRRLIQIIRKSSVLISIFIVSEYPVNIKGSNGWVHPSQISGNNILNQLNEFPQQYVWLDVFGADIKNQKN